MQQIQKAELENQVNEKREREKGSGKRQKTEDGENGKQKAVVLPMKTPVKIKSSASALGDNLEEMQIGGSAVHENGIQSGSAAAGTTAADTTTTTDWSAAADEEDGQ